MEEKKEYKTRPQEDFDFLKTLPPDQQRLVRDLAHQHGILYGDAYDQMVRQEVDDAIQSRGSQHSP